MYVRAYILIRDVSCTYLYYNLQILNEIAKHNIRIYEFPDVEDEDENNTLKKLKVWRVIYLFYSLNHSLVWHLINIQYYILLILWSIYNLNGSHVLWVLILYDCFLVWQDPFLFLFSQNRMCTNRFSVWILIFFDVSRDISAFYSNSYLEFYLDVVLISINLFAAFNVSMIKIMTSILIVTK